MGKKATTVIPDGTREDFYALLDKACTTIVPPSKPATRAPKGKPESVSAKSGERQ